MGDKLSKIISVIKKDGIQGAARKIFRYASGVFKKHMGLFYRIDFLKNRAEYERILKEALSGNNGNGGNDGNDGSIERIIIWRSSFGWRVPLFQRPQHISRALSKNKCLVFYEVTSMTDPTRAIEKMSDNLYLVNFSNRLFSKILFSEIESLNVPRYLQFYSTDWTMKLSEVKDFTKRGYKVLYEYIDELSPGLAGTKELPVNVAEKYSWVMQSDENALVVVTADKLRDDVISRRGERRMTYAANGVDFDFFNDLSSPPRFEPEFKSILDSGKILVGYYGAMAAWLDYELIKKVSDVGDFLFVLIGIRYDDSLDKSGVLSLDNVKFLGAKDYSVLKYYASRLDVMTIPFVINDVTEATSPLKLFEYMALAKPVVTTDMKECRKCKTPLIAHSHDEFISLLYKAKDSSGDEKKAAALKDEARENSWTVKSEAILEMLREDERRGGSL